MRQEYEMTPDELEELLDASKPTPCMMIGGVPPRTPLQNANAAWRELGRKRGFDSDTVRPITGKDQTFFTAEPMQTAPTSV